MRKKLIFAGVLAFVLICALAVSAGAAEVVKSGECGDDARYTLDSDGTLTISGNGLIYNYSKQDAVPWFNQIIKKIVIEDGITTIGDYAFYSAVDSNCQDIVIPDSVVSIRKAAFWGCSLKNKELKLSNNLRFIGDNAFGFSSLPESIDLPESLLYIDMGAFQMASGLKSIRIPKGVTTIDSGTFYGCDDLQTVELHEGITLIGDEAFAGCSSLTSIEIPSGVTTIGREAFGFAAGYCDSLTKVTIYSRTVKIDDTVFSTCPNLTLYGYAGSTAETYAEENDIPFVVLQETHSITGRVTSWNSSCQATAKLYKEDELVAETTATGGSGFNYTATFTLNDIADGRYTLVISKPAHLSFTVTDVVVNGEDVDLTANASKSYSNIVLIPGDNNGDGCVDLQDLIILTSSNNYGKAAPVVKFGSDDNVDAITVELVDVNDCDMEAIYCSVLIDDVEQIIDIVSVYDSESNAYVYIADLSAMKVNKCLNALMQLEAGMKLEVLPINGSYRLITEITW